MNNTMKTVTLLKHTLPLNDLAIGQAIDIAKSFPESRNEARIGALIGHVTGDSTLARSLTVNERYYFLLRHQAAIQNPYTASTFDIDDYVRQSVQSDVPEKAAITDAAYVGHLYGAHVQVLEQKCENAADWLNGQMICQLYGDISSILGGDDDIHWDKIPATASEEEINKAIEERLPMLNKLSANNQYNDLALAFMDTYSQLDHFVTLGLGTDGLLVHGADDTQGGAGIKPRRFLCLSAIGGIAGKIIATFDQ